MINGAFFVIGVGLISFSFFGILRNERKEHEREMDMVKTQLTDTYGLTWYYRDGELSMTPKPSLGEKMDITKVAKEVLVYERSMNYPAIDIKTLDRKTTNLLADGWYRYSVFLQRKGFVWISAAAEQIEPAEERASE